MTSTYQGTIAVICYEALPTDCIECGATSFEEQELSFLMINPEGEGIICQNHAHICQGCPRMYLPNAQFHHTAKLFEYDPYAIVGVIDLAIWPKEKQTLPIEPDENGQLPLVEFEKIEALRPAQIDLGALDQLSGFGP